MTRRLVVPLASLAVGVTGAGWAAGRVVDLERLLRFADARACMPAPELERLIGSMIVDGANRPRAGKPIMPPSLRPVTGRLRFDRQGQSYLAELPLVGRWAGLHVRALRRWMAVEGDSGGFSVQFAEPPARVRQVLNRRGFDLPVRGFREQGEELPFSISVVPYGGGSTLTCGT